MEDRQAPRIIQIDLDEVHKIIGQVYLQSQLDLRAANRQIQELTQEVARLRGLTEEKEDTKGE